MRYPAAILATAVGLVAAACGSASPAPPADTPARTTPRTIHVAADTTKTFPRGAAIAGDTIVCDGRGGGAGAPMKPGSGVTSSMGIDVRMGLDGRLRVSCPPAKVGPGPFS